ncbi:glycosyltransferase [Anatilimnocola sp. NA78]|uniref:glycosyltransferase n=1 Tax=Anatilimnocola sp. NA78 TaxID=3415683 RepID=UPI003CE4F4A6
MKLAALCCTFRRSHLLGELIESFLRQTYPSDLRELIILDDAGEYGNQQGEGWRIISLPRRFRTLGEKRNACAALASHDVEGLLVADDDDIYLPHWFAAQAEALQRAEWSRPKLVLHEHRGGLQEHETGGLYHGGWALRRSAFDRVRGYSSMNNGEDQELANRLQSANVTCCDPGEFGSPFYLYRVHNNSYHVSYLDDQAYRNLEVAHTAQQPLKIGWQRAYDQMPVRRRYAFAPLASSTGNGGRRVELIGPVTSAGRNGPTNGMFALQRALRGRIAEGLDWLTIKDLPVSQGALPWFWNWQDRSYAAWCDAMAQPFIQGPNMLFINSATPRIDPDECALLDARHCRAMFCHSAWYRDLIRRHRGPNNQSPIMLWPYPIDPWPGEPLPDRYDLLIYAKNGNRPGLLEYLAEAYPRHVQIHYGQYDRQQLFDAARRSRACVYLADDDHGPLALVEILLAGCPVVGVRTGAALVQQGVTGLLVERLPSGDSCANRRIADPAAMQFLQALEQIQAFDRSAVRIAAAAEFSTSRIVDQLLLALDELRQQD